MHVFSLISVQPLTYCSCNGCIGVDTGSIAMQCEQVCFFRGLEKRCFCMNDVAPATCLADLASRLFTFLQANPSLSFGEGHFVNFYLTSCFPDDEIWDIGARISKSVSPSEAFGLTSVLLDSRVTVEQKRELAL